jgi:hypothetical protein
VLWSDHPLSAYALAEKTIIDGQIYFDREEDARLREYVRAERSRISNKMLAEKRKGTAVIKPSEKKHRLYHCNSIENVAEEETIHR